ncbi:hypothetical protein BDV95DRAFT_606351 [Massariosphaeria phaeospora]|uniref:Uncharacterized protein n=1 Tax=Massariosphaeria phaeospora TaxID=100035 RepID=A0A7C8I7Q9_9PLEO|nr:hypothetical protein BDV95DRAFT_606351 [Massariosphaeria phaeospora]
MKASLSFLADLPLYTEEKPYELWLPPDQLPEDIPVTNCHWVKHTDIQITDLRHSVLNAGLDTTGFKFLSDPLDFDLRGEHLLSTNPTETLARYLNSTADVVGEELGWGKKDLLWLEGTSSVE